MDCIVKHNSEINDYRAAVADAARVRAFAEEARARGLVAEDADDIDAFFSLFA